MQTRAFILQDWRRPLSGDHLAEWVKVLGLLAGIGAIPLLVRLPWLARWYWAVSLAAGLLVVGTGLFYWFRSGRLARAQAQTADPDQVLVDNELIGRSIRVTARGIRQADEAAAIPTKKPAAIRVETGAGRLDDIHQATILILLGIFILLPAIAGMLLGIAGVADTHRVAAYLGSPALMLWAAFESVALYSHWQLRTSGQAAILGMASSGAHGLAALLIWIFLGLADSTDWISWLFWVGAGLAGLGALAGILTPPAGRKRSAPSEGAAPEASLAGSGPGNISVEPVPVTEESTGIKAPVPNLEILNEAERSAAGGKAPVVTSRAVFQIFRGKNGQYYFRLRAANGEPILSSEGYLAKPSCRKGIKSVRQNAPLLERYERRETRNGQHYFVLKAANHRVIGASESYTTPAGRESGIEAVMRVAPQAGVKEVEAGYG